MNKAAPIAEIQAVVAAYYKQPRRIMLNREPCLPAPQVRQVAMYLSHVLLGKSKSAIARAFRMDRTTIHYGIAVVAERIQASTELDLEVRELKSLLQPVDIGDSERFSANSNAIYDREQSMKTQVELAA